jgi:DNA-3-methyladenine glycosylase II
LNDTVVNEEAAVEAKTVLVREHPGWTTVPGGAVRFMQAGTAPMWLRWDARSGRLSHGAVLPANAEVGPAVDQCQSTSSDLNNALGPALADLGSVLRVRNADLWDAIGTAIIRQVIRAGQARSLYQRFCQGHGESATSPTESGFLFPSAEKVAGLSPDAFAELGMAFKRPALMAAAEAYLARGPHWRVLPAEELVSALQAVPRIGPWTAGAASADFTGNFAVYPYADLAVRTWARRAAPDVDWPTDEAGFGTLWRRISGYRLSDLTLLTLAWGDNHARAQPPPEQPGSRP